MNASVPPDVWSGSPAAGSKQGQRERILNREAEAACKPTGISGALTELSEHKKCNMLH